MLKMKVHSWHCSGFLEQSKVSVHISIVLSTVNIKTIAIAVNTVDWNYNHLVV